MKIRERQLKGIETILNLIEDSTETYDSQSGLLLADFVAVFGKIRLQGTIKEEELKKDLNSFNNKYRYTDEYYSTAFLWYACDLIKQATIMLIANQNMLEFIRTSLGRAYSLIKNRVDRLKKYLGDITLTKLYFSGQVHLAKQILKQKGKLEKEDWIYINKKSYKNES